MEKQVPWKLWKRSPRGGHILNVSQPVNQAYLEKLHLAFSTGQTQFCEFELENAGGELLFLSCQIIPEFDGDGKVTSVLSHGQ